MIFTSKRSQMHLCTRGATTWPASTYWPQLQHSLSSCLLRQETSPIRCCACDVTLNAKKAAQTGAYENHNLQLTLPRQDNTGKWIRENRMLIKLFLERLLLSHFLYCAVNGVNWTTKIVNLGSTDTRGPYRGMRGSEWERGDDRRMTSAVESCGDQRPESHGLSAAPKETENAFGYDHAFIMII